MARKTPSMGVSGTFILRDPFVANPAKSYTVVALRTFQELVARGQDPLALIYTPVTLTQSAYNSDKAEGALVVCLKDNTGNLIYVPDTWIDSYPNMGSVTYSRLVLGVSMGMWPEYRDLTDVIQAIKEAVRSKIGVDAEVVITRSVATDAVSEAQHAQLTAARENAVIENETDTAKIIRLSDELAARDATIAEQDLIIQTLVEAQN